LQFGGASCEDLLINAYSKDLRMKALHAVDRATPRKKVVVVRTFGVSLAALKRWLKRRREGEEYLMSQTLPRAHAPHPLDAAAEACPIDNNSRRTTTLP
jgi:transposase